MDIIHSKENVANWIERVALKLVTSQERDTGPRNYATEPVGSVAWPGGWTGEKAALLASLHAPFFWLTLLAALLAMLAVYQLPVAKKISMDSTGDRAYLVDFNTSEDNGELVYRWTRPSSLVSLPGFGQPAELKLKLEISPRPLAVTSRTLDLSINAQPLESINLAPDERKTYVINYYPLSRSPFSLKLGDLKVGLQSEYYKPRGDRRKLGVAISDIRVEAPGLMQSGRITIPTWSTLGQLLCTLALLGLASFRAGWRGQPQAALLLVPTVVIVSGLAFDRVFMGLTAPLLLSSAALAYIFMSTGLLFTSWWLKRNGTCLEAQQARWLAIIFVLAFMVRATGINHPTFQTLDHGFRIHEAAALLNEPDLIISRYYNINSGSPVGGADANSKTRAVTAGQWEMALPVPYSPLFYLTDFPLAALFRNDEPSFLFWTNIYALWLETTAIFLLYITAKQTFGRFGQDVGLLGGIGLGFFPLSFLMPSDGGYPTMQAQWLTLAFIAVLSGWLAHPKEPAIQFGWRRVAGGGLIVGLAMLAHTSTMLLLSTLLVLLAGLLAVWGRERILAVGLVRVTLAGWLFSFGLYYGFYIWPLLTTTLPALTARVGQGQGVGDRAQSLKGLWVQVLAHFHLFPFLLTTVVTGFLVYLAWQSRHGIKSSTPGLTGTLRREINLPATLLLLSWHGTFLIFSLVDNRINLLQKHMIFALPLFALGMGLTLAVAQEIARTYRPARLYRRLVKASGVVVAVYIVAAGCYIWFIRVVYYILPAGSG